MLRTRSRNETTREIARRLHADGWCAVPDAVGPAIAAALADEAAQMWDEGEYRAARVGSGSNQHLAPAIRSDRIHWIDDASPSPAQAAYLGFLEEARREINQQTFLGLHEWEGHLAVYPPGSRYRRHLDVFANAKERVVSTILYLNRDWRSGDGGELRLWTTPVGEGQEDGSHVDIEPRFGTLVAFLSRDHFHEVLTAHRDRFSVTGWFRVRSLA